MEYKNYLITYWIPSREIAVKHAIKVASEIIPDGFDKNALSLDYRDFVIHISPDSVVGNSELVGIEDIDSIITVDDKQSPKHTDGRNSPARFYEPDGYEEGFEPERQGPTIFDGLYIE